MRLDRFPKIVCSESGVSRHIAFNTMPRDFPQRDAVDSDQAGPFRGGEWIVRVNHISL